MVTLWYGQLDHMGIICAASEDVKMDVSLLSRHVLPPAA